ncbi:energy transducer TonB [Marinihelvus fidelis]|uniref:Energy transducer TonB n=1 Tax=Marinihelvus fidelis TaxID=2613842 RepID=A0A5N0TC98_9GAMM|nr:TonB family protein [Marinihelvus fidelis]KAA9130959.1 energy transducer TonB [Marinihelvus fidelis]
MAVTGNLFNDRFSIAFALALGIHALVLLGVSFVLDINPLRKAAETLDVVLVNWRSETAPDEAEFLAQVSQLGGGESEEAEKPSQEISPDIPSVDEGMMPVSSEEVVPEESPESRETVTAETPDARPAQQITDIEQPLPVMPSAAELMQQSMQVAQMQPEHDRDTEWQSKLPRRRFISANTREYEFATYMAAWVAKVERVGNLNYPTELKQRGIAGDLLMTVGIDSAGGVESISVQRSSGIPELDRAAERIVRLAAPFSPLPADIAAKVDVLHITRTWRFSAGHRFE